MADLNDRRETHWVKGLYLRGTNYRFKRRVNGRIVIDCLGRIPFDEAERKVRRLNLAVEDGVDIQQTVARTRKTFAVHAQEWLRKKRAQLGDGASVRRYQAITDNFNHFLATQNLGNAPLSDIGYAVCDDYITHRRTAPIMSNGQRSTPNANKFTRKSCCKFGAAKKTVHEEKSVLKAVFKEARQRGFVLVNPWEDVVTEKPTKDEILEKHHPLTREECSRLIAAAVTLDQRKKQTPSLADIITFAVNTGCREDEICKLEWSDIDLKERLIRVRRKKVTETRQKRGACVETREYVWKPKASQGDIPMNETVKSLLGRLHLSRHSNFVFAQGDGGSCRLRLLRLTQRAAALAGIKGRLRFHDLRHTFGTLLRERDVALENIKVLMRHADLKETQLYAKPNPQAAHNAVKLLEIT